MAQRNSASNASASSSSNTEVPDATVPDRLAVSRDLERASRDSILHEDPFQFRDGLVSEDDIEGLRQRKKGKKLVKYHRRQNDLITALLKPMEEHSEDARADQEGARTSVRIAVYASLISNLVLCAIQLYAAISSASLSLIATAIDSVFDIGSNFLLFFLHRKAASLDVNKWPVGGTRLETIGNVIYGFLMGSVNLVVIVESVRSIITNEGEANEFHIPSIIAVGSALVVKLILFLYSYSIRKQSSQVQMLWEDHRNDLWLNTFGILMSVGGSKLIWFLDPLGGVLIASGIIISWGRTVYSEFELLAGKSAPHNFLQLLIYKAATFSDDIEKIDTVRAYHSGPEYFVEIDIVMNGDTPLWKAHDISQQLQDKMEDLPNVGRAFVHVDYETTHVPEHRKAPKMVI